MPAVFTSAIISWNYRQHASHLAATALYAKNNWGVNFATVDPFNEPSSNWWTATGRQETTICHSTCRRLAPSTMAASSRLRGTWSKKLFSSQVAIGSV